MLIKYVWFQIANITHALPVQVYRQTDFTPKRVVVSRLHDAAARFRTGVKFSPRYKNRGELTLGWLAPAWHFVVVSCKQIHSHERELEWTRSGVKVAPVSCKHPLRFAYCFACSSTKQIKHAPPPSLHLHLTFHQWRSQNNVISLIFALSTKNCPLLWIHKHLLQKVQPWLWNLLKSN